MPRIAMRQLWRQDVLYVFSTNTKLVAFNTNDIMTLRVIQYGTEELLATCLVYLAQSSLMEDGTFILLNQRSNCTQSSSWLGIDLGALEREMSDLGYETGN
jgi:hypothetical protein